MSVEMSAVTELLRLPIVEPFTGAEPNNPNWKFLDYARLSQECLILNPNYSNTTLPALALLDQPFPSAQGVIIDFDLAKSREDNNFDGLCVFLIDGQKTTGRGSAVGIGYAPDDTTRPPVPGVTAGWVGIGFDNLGYFSGRFGDYYDDRAELLAVRGCGDSTSGFDLLTTVHVPGGFGSSWDKGEHIQVCLLDGRLSIRRSSAANPEGELLLDSFDLAGQPGQVAIPETFKLGLAGVTFETNSHSQIRNLTVAAGGDPIGIDYQIVAQWSQSYPDDAKGWVVSYDLTLTSHTASSAMGDLLRRSIGHARQSHPDPVVSGGPGRPAKYRGDRVSRRLAHHRPRHAADSEPATALPVPSPRRRWQSGQPPSPGDHPPLTPHDNQFQRIQPSSTVWSQQCPTSSPRTSPAPAQPSPSRIPTPHPLPI
jgi:hypothetical protein